MRIAIVCPYYPFPPSVGGVENIVKQVATELAKRNYEVHIITTPLDVTTQRPVTSLGIEKRDEIIIHKLRPGTIKLGYARIIHGLKETVTKIKPDIVHAHNLHPHLFQLVKWKKELKYKIISELHHPGITISKLSQLITLPFAMLYLKRIQGHIDIFVVHTQIEGLWLLEKGINKEKIYKVFFPAIDSKLLTYTPRKQYNIDLCFVGRIVREKGIHILIKALREVIMNLKNIKLWIVGPVDINYYKKLKKLISKLNLNNYIEFKGPIYNNSKYDIIASSKLFVLPSFKEYTPNVLLEAQALGTPVIASNVGAIPEMVINGETGFLIKPGAIKEYASALTTLLQDDKLRKAMSIKAKKWAGNFTYNKAINELIMLYKKLNRT